MKSATSVPLSDKEINLLFKRLNRRSPVSRIHVRPVFPNVGVMPGLSQSPIVVRTPLK